MISIQTRRIALLVIAATVDDNRQVSMTWGFTQEGASRRLCRLLDRSFARAAS